MSLSQSPAVIHSGWLTKSPPTESASLFKPRWRKRWMVLLQGSDSESYLLCYYTDESKTKLKGTINLKHCMTISSSLLVPPSSKSKQVELVGGGQTLEIEIYYFQVFMFSLLTPDRVYQFSSDNKQLIDTWIEILTNACKKNPFFESLDDDLDSSRDKSQVFDESLNSTSIKKSLKDPYIHLTECYSGNFPPPPPPRPAKSSLDVRKRLELERDVENDIQYLDLHFPSQLNKDFPEEVDDSDDADSSFNSRGKEEEEIIYHNIDFIRTKAFNETRREVESDKYNIKH